MMYHTSNSTTSFGMGKSYSTSKSYSIEKKVNGEYCVSSFRNEDRTTASLSEAVSLVIGEYKYDAVMIDGQWMCVTTHINEIEFTFE